MAPDGALAGGHQRAETQGLFIMLESTGTSETLVSSKRKKAFIVGAGASLAYGYPSGASLRSQILGITDGNHNCNLLQVGPSTLKNFQDAFRRSQLFSIDAFLGRRGEFSEVGKRCIAKILLECEERTDLFRVEPDDHWYRLLFNYLAREPWESLKLEDFSVVTFNYDRSLEEYLLGALMSTYDRSRLEAEGKLQELKIVHVYGSISAAASEDANFIRYGTGAHSHTIQIAAKRLKVIPESRSDSLELAAAREILINADSIAILGFGFDPTNVERLSENGACRTLVQRSSTNLMRSIVGTRVGMFDQELRQRFTELTRGPKGERPQTIRSPDGFRNESCTDLLRSSLFLEH